MIPGPEQIVACPNCQALAKYATLRSGNTFGARVWTDGKQIAPMLPRPPAVVMCHHCAECYWLADAEEVGTIDPWDDETSQIDPAWTAARVIQEPVEDEYYQALDKGLAANSQQERTLRILAWWRRNDAFRDTPPAGISTIAATARSCRNNLEVLASLLDEGNENDRLMKAEVLRELGEFDSVKLVLSGVTAADYAEVVRQLSSLCDIGDTSVRELEFGS